MKQSFLILFLCVFFSANSQEWIIPKVSNGGWELDQAHTLDKRKRNILLISEASLYTVSLVGLNQLWYADYAKSNFHFIDDNREWLQMDKIGHMTSSYYIGVAGIKAYKWTGMSRKNSIWYGGMTGSLFLLIIEILDGHSAEWGASSGDLIANTSGSLLAIAQELKWDEQRIQLKYSYSPSRFSDKNPEQLGRNHLEKALKDYNGQTYWMSCNIKSLMQIENENFPNWFSVSLGYGGDYMLQPYPDRNKKSDSFKRQFLLSFDVDLNRIKTKNKTMSFLLNTFGFLKFPAPAIQYMNGNISFYPIYY